MLRSLLRYHYLKLIFPQFAYFLNEGFGIEARHKRCAKHWAKHLELCKKFQRDSLINWPAGGRVAVLGAGRLYDIDLTFLSENFSEIRLYDADPAALRSLPQNSARIGTRLLDLTGGFDQWRSLIKAQKAPSLETLANCVRSLKAPSFSLPQQIDCVISINLLSQIALAWRDWFTRYATKSIKVKLDDQANLPQPLKGALENSLAQIQSRHLELLWNSGARRVILISDEEFFYYQAEKSDWICEPALFCDWTPNPANFKLENTESWLWHIAPQGIEEKEYGVIHRVRALGYDRADR